MLKRNAEAASVLVIAALVAVKCCWTQPQVYAGSFKL
jgi:hypothetical protein